MADCIFCQIAGKKTPAELVHEDDLVVAFPDKFPQAPVHLLVVPKEHHPDFHDLDDPAIQERLFAVARRLGRDHSPEHGYRLMVNSGNQADIGHVHIHVLGGRPPSQGGDSE